jgi:hexosaminidase
MGGITGGVPVRVVSALLWLSACAGRGGHPDTADTDDTGSGFAAAPRLVPLPALVEQARGVWALDEDTRIVATAGAEGVAELLGGSLRPATGLPLLVASDDAGSGDIALVLEPARDLPAEGYELDVDDAGVVVTASDAAGLFYGTQTLRQLLPPDVFSATLVDDVAWEMPLVHIEDAPRYAWRGAMLDVARHFFDVAQVERQVDLLASHKMNRLHLHLTDDQGWRIEIRSWPLLTEIGGSTEVGGGPGGWYTQDDYAAIVAYAADRFVTIVPEIDFPGHANAALASYGELTESGEPNELYTGEDVISVGLWLDGPATAGFVADVWHEVAAMTPGAWVHVGADEAIDSTPDAYATFVAGLQDVVSAEGKTMIGWDEIGGVTLAPPFIAQHWYDADNARAAVAQGGDLIASPAEHAYLDMVYDRSAEYGQVWAGPIDVERAYSWSPAPTGVDDSAIQGVEGALWTEFIDTPEKLDFMFWPRLAAHAEVGWSPTELQDWDDFRDRLAWHGARLDAEGVGFYHSPEVDWVESGDSR